MRSDPPGMEVRGVVRSYAGASGAVLALDRVSATFPTGTFTVVAGPSGSGKSTLLRLTSLLDKPSEGQVLLGGVDVTEVSARERRLLRRRQVGYMFQQPSDNLLDYLSARQHVRLGHDLREAADDAGADDLLAFLGLAQREQHRLAHLSGGEQQRLALAFAAAGGPTLLVADEPTAALDHASGALVVEALSRLADRGVTVIASSHDPAVVAAGARGVRIDQGRVVR